MSYSSSAFAPSAVLACSSAFLFASAAAFLFASAAAALAYISFAFVIISLSFDVSEPFIFFRRSTAFILIFGSS